MNRGRRRDCYVTPFICTEPDTADLYRSKRDIYQQVRGGDGGGLEERLEEERMMEAH